MEVITSTLAEVYHSLELQATRPPNRRCLNEMTR
jgi:hypothetical protein